MSNIDPLFSTLHRCIKEAAEKYIRKLEIDHVFSQPIVTELKALGDFYPAEDYHVDYFQQNRHLPYCQLVIAPKIKQLEEKFAAQLKRAA